MSSARWLSVGLNGGVPSGCPGRPDVNRSQGCPAPSTLRHSKQLFLGCSHCGVVKEGKHGGSSALVGRSIRQQVMLLIPKS